MSMPLLTGRIQSPLFSIDSATTASRGSPFVLKSVSPRKGRSITHEITITAMSGMFFSFIFIFFSFGSEILFVGSQNVSRAKVAIKTKGILRFRYFMTEPIGKENIFATFVFQNTP